MNEPAPAVARKAMWWLGGKIAYSVGFGVVVLLAIGAALFYFSARATARPQVVRIGYGAGGPVRKHFLEQMALRGKDHHLDIRLFETGGADQTMSLIDQKVADLGLITGAIDDQAGRKVFELAPLYMEPLQLLVRAELYDAVVKDFGTLKGKSIGLDSESSTTNLLATELLRFIGLADPATGAPFYRPVHTPQSRLTYQADGASLPEAIFQIAGIPSPGVRSLIAAHNYRLVPLPFCASFNLDKFREEESQDFNAARNLRLNRAFVEESIIPAFTYGVLPAVPPEDTRTIATRLILVGGQTLDDRLVFQLLDLILSPDISGLAQPPLNVDLLNSSFQFQRHPGTDRYLGSLRPIDVEGAFVAYSRLVEVWGIIIAGYIFAARGLKSWRQRQLPKRAAAGDFLLKVLDVEAQAGPACTPADRIALDQRLTDIKKAALELHVAGNLDDAEILPSLLVTLADTRTRIWGSAS
jgi:TRAP-type uncharacterized transport system substrate-binding protein